MTKFNVTKSALLFLMSTLYVCGQKNLNKLIYQDDFSGDLSQWNVEQMKGGTSKVKDGELVINDAKGCTVWFKHKLSGRIAIEYDAVMVDKGGKFDRVSDLNCFWMATDMKHLDNIFVNSKERGGSFKNYHALKLYYVGYGANKNTTTRFRRYIGNGDRPVLPEHDLTDKKFLNVANKVIKIKLVADGEKIQYWRDDELVFDVLDKEPYTEGWFGFRTVKNHLKIDNFKVYQLQEIVE